jgi:hypothetical protein
MKSLPVGDAEMLAAVLMLSHFWAMILFALLVSIVLGALTRRSTIERVKYAAWSFLLFLLFGVGAAWLMYPFSR